MDSVVKEWTWVLQRWFKVLHPLWIFKREVMRCRLLVTWAEEESAALCDASTSAFVLRLTCVCQFLFKLTSMPFVRPAFWTGDLPLPRLWCGSQVSHSWGLAVIYIFPALLRNLNYNLLKPSYQVDTCRSKESWRFRVVEQLSLCVC